MPTRTFPSSHQLNLYDFALNDEQTRQSPSHPPPYVALKDSFESLKTSPIEPIVIDEFVDSENGMFVYSVKKNPAVGETVLSTHFTSHNGYDGTFEFSCLVCNVEEGIKRKRMWEVALNLSVKLYGYEDHDYFNELFQKHAAAMFTNRTQLSFDSIPSIIVKPRTTRLGERDNFKLSFSPSIGMIRIDTVCIMLNQALRQAIVEADQDFVETWGEPRPPASQARVPWLSF